MNNIIFLDIDGVLNNEKFFKENDEEIDKNKIILLNNFCKETNSKIVISSTWKYLYSKEKLIDIFKNSGATFDIIDITPNFCKIKNKGVEIENWIDKNIKNIKNYVIFDDEINQFLINQSKHIIETNFYSEGLTYNHCKKAKKILNNKKIIENINEQKQIYSMMVIIK